MTTHVCQAGVDRYIQIGAAPANKICYLPNGVDLDCFLSCYPIPQSYLLGITNAEQRQRLAQWGLPDDGSVTNAVQWNMNYGSGSTASAWRPMPPHEARESAPFTKREVRVQHQAVYPLVDFIQSKAETSAGKSGIELRILLEPLRSQAIRMTSNETDRTNYIHGFGLAMPMEQALQAIKERPMDQ